MHYHPGEEVGRKKGIHFNHPPPAHGMHGSAMKTKVNISKWAAIHAQLTVN